MEAAALIGIVVALAIGFFGGKLYAQRKAEKDRLKVTAK